jgi:pimeloyl-ACP methyl ester carboxylesterase
MIGNALAVMDALGLERAALVGQSMAGRIAIGIALEAPDRVSKLALIGAVGTGVVPGSSLLAFVPSAAYRFVEPFTSRLVFRLVLDRAYGSVGRASARDLEEYFSQTADPNYLHAVWSLLRKFDWRPLPASEFARLRMPVLFLTGARDHVVKRDRLESLARGMHDARVVIVPRAGHLVNEEAPDPANKALVSFLAEA